LFNNSSFEATLQAFDDSTDENVTLIPREALVSTPDKFYVKISSDGSKISYVTPLDGTLNVWVEPVSDPESARPVTNEMRRGISGYSWAYTSNHILYKQDETGYENYHIYSVNLSNNKTIDLTPFEGVRAVIMATSYKIPDEIVIGINNRSPYYQDLYETNIDTGSSTLLLENNEFLDFGIDEDFKVLFGNKWTPDGGIEMIRIGSNSSEGFLKIDMADSLTTQPLGFNKAGDEIYLTDSRERDTAALYSLNISTKKETLIAADPRSDVTTNIIFHPTEKNVQAMAFNYERLNWTVIDPSIAEDVDYLTKLEDGDMKVASQSLDNKAWIVEYLKDDGPNRYYLYDFATKRARFLFGDREALQDMPLAKMVPMVIKSRDGLDLVCYYTLPIDSDKDGDGLPDKPLPMVLYVHGGPWGRDNWGYNSIHQWLANRGYAVMSVNFRGSLGFGKNFANAGDLEWGRKMQYDLIDAANWSIQQGITDPQRIAIMGASYGGYAALAGLTFTPKFFACGIDLFGPSNLITHLESRPFNWMPDMNLWISRVGDVNTEEGRALLSERSPINYVDNIKRPLLVAQGVNDSRVNKNESDQIVQAMQKKNLSVTYVLYSDEGHGFAMSENDISFFAIAEAFLAEHLGGRFEPITSKDLYGSTMTVPVGASEIPGLEAALSGNETNRMTGSIA
jgi:dipeptidyl aminopeptidase/acylaminoacyl peptidase